MKYTSKKFPHSPKGLSICDAHIDAISCSENMVRFIFFEGFSVITGDTVKKTSKGYIELLNCNADEFSCHIIQRKSTPAGAELRGKPISLTELAELLDSGKKIEVFLELYDFNYLYWRGVLLPHKRKGLSDNIVIQIGGCFSVTYFWE